VGHRKEDWTVADLLWKTKNDTRTLLASPFKSEAAFEKMVFETPGILEDIFLINRQVRGGNKQGIPDIVGIDKDGNICIVEMKNTPVDHSIIPQVLQYAIWAENSPDSIKNLWYECPNRPDELDFNIDLAKVRIVVVAPNIAPSTLNAVGKITYDVELVEVTKWEDGDDQFLLVHRLEEADAAKTVRPVTGLQNYDADFYKREYNRHSAEEFLKYVEEVETVVKEKGWALETKYNKGYCGFKAGSRNAFGVQWMGSKTFAFWFKLSEAEATSVGIPMTKYDSGWKQAFYYVEPGKTNTRDFLPLFQLAYNKLTGD
jgi:hypothetical protein